jgi:hypothetical protein
MCEVSVGLIRILVFVTKKPALNQGQASASGEQRPCFLDEGYISFWGGGCPFFGCFGFLEGILLPCIQTKNLLQYECFLFFWL